MLQGVLTKYAFRSMQAAWRDPKRMKEATESALRALRSNPGMAPELRRRLEAFLSAAVALSEQAASSGQNYSERVWNPLKIEVSPVQAGQKKLTNNFQITFPQGIVWAMISCAATFGISLVVERSHGTLMRLRMAPIGRAAILGGKALACWGVTVGVSVLLLVIARIGFGVRPGSVPLLVLAVLSASVTFVGIMMCLCVFGKTERSAGGIGWAVLMMLAMVGGGSIPLAFMPGWLQAVSNFSPVKWAVLALEGAIWRGFTLREMLLPCGILVAVGACCFAVGVRAFRWTQQQ